MPEPVALPEIEEKKEDIQIKEELLEVKSEKEKTVSVKDVEFESKLIVD